MKQKALVKSIGGNYTPPIVRETPKVKNGVATITLAAPLSERALESLRTAFRNCCAQKGLRLRMFINGCIITIMEAVSNILWEVIEWLELKLPPKAPPAQSKKPPVLKRSLKSPPLFHPSGGPRLVTSN
ncbi:MAG: hypothetical protein A3J06_02930 [Candidatus Moranbacteria bacterium RIFCSPLOWO2_02_FULL_48_19]|nr:MAG: hypothetical protein A3J06_02930 [Candidatus Moranbacteria bacterium RIFCSPLOWO2_02_FULL_48_19]OGI29895.1 MAG: hypothetical protein A3G09_04825 [Candidatus Moranbacteria bacterium RIFCSPLOWO2_12_FULL_48_12]